MEAYNRNMPGYGGIKLKEQKYNAEVAKTAPVRGDYICIGAPLGTTYNMMHNEASRLKTRETYPAWVPGAGGPTGQTFRDFFRTTYDSKFSKEGMSPSGAGVLAAAAYNDNCRPYAGYLKTTREGATLPDGRKFAFSQVTSEKDTGYNAKGILAKFVPSYKPVNAALGGTTHF